MTGAEPLLPTAEDLLFGVRRSVRYHNRRRSFFDRLHTIASAMNVIFGSAAVALVVGKLHEAAVISAAIVAALSAIDLVVGFSTKARLHNDLSKRFIRLEQRLLACRKPSRAELQDLNAARLEIEMDEPPALRVLDSICHNELVRAMGAEEENFKKIGLVQRLFAQFFDLWAHTIK